MDNSIRYQESRRITLLGAAKNAFLAIIKIIFGFTGHSHALLADGVHSLSDLLIDGLVLIASRFGSKSADYDHPYGHGRIETAATIVLAFILVLAGSGIIYDAAIEVIGNRAPVIPSFYVLFIALASVIVNEVLFFYTKRTGEKVKSNLLIANAWHHRSDSLSSIVVLIGVAAAWFGFGKFDAIAAIIVGIMVIHMAGKFAWTSLRELVDTGLEPEQIEKIKAVIRAVPGVRALHQLRTRLVGGVVFLDVHIQVSPMLSVSEGHYIGQQVHFRLMQEISDIEDVTVHVDPEDDEMETPSRNLPNRHEIISLLKARWHNQLVEPYIDNLILHYLSGKLHVELRLPHDWLQSAENLQQLADQLREAVNDIPQIATVKLLFVL